MGGSMENVACSSYEQLEARRLIVSSYTLGGR